MDAACFAPDAREPLGLWTGVDRTRPTPAGGRRVPFEYSSRGDRVPGRILLPPDGSGPLPILLLAHAATNAAADAIAERCVQGGAAVACIDLPLHGARASSKLGALLDQEPGPRPATPLAAGILREFTRQAVLDLRRGLDALARVEGLDARRVAFAGIGLGAAVGAAFCAHDARPCAAVLALATSGGAPELDPLPQVGRIAPRPILFVSSAPEAPLPRAAAERLHAAAAGPREVVWVEAEGAALPPHALDAIAAFLREHLHLPRARA